MDREIEAQRERSEQHSGYLQELAMINGRPDVEFHDETIVDPRSNESRQVQLEEHSKQYR